MTAPAGAPVDEPAAAPFRAPPRPGQRLLNRAPLVRQLVSAGLAEPPPAAARTLAERLSPWLAWTDAIALSQVLAQPLPGASAGAGAEIQALPAAVAGMQAALRRLREEAEQAIDSIDVDGPAVDAAWRGLWRVQQQTLAARIAPLRSQLRALAARQGAALAQLAAIDAVLETALAGRERSLLASIPAWLQRQGDDAAGRVHALMHAELALRLQPLEGLLSALSQPRPDVKAPGAPNASDQGQPA